MNISYIPSELFKLIHLEILILNNNNLDKVINNFSRLKNLKQLHLQNNKIESFEASFKKIELLDLSHNNIDIFPKKILKLTSLKILNLSFNKLTRIDNNIHLLSNLIELEISNNYIFLLRYIILSLDDGLLILGIG